MDLKALYPSMKWADIVVAVRAMIQNSLMDVKTPTFENGGFRHGMLIG
jgi:hypothetical protein